MPVEAEYFKKGFDTRNEQILQSAYGNYTSNKHGPLGLFLLEDGCTLVAHDAGNFYKFSIHAVKKSLKT